MIPKLHGSRHVLRSIVHISNINTLKSIYYVYFILPSSHKYDIGHVKLSLHSLHYIRTFIHNIHNKKNLQYIYIRSGTQ